MQTVNYDSNASTRNISQCSSAPLVLTRANRRQLLGLTLVWVTLDSVHKRDMGFEDMQAASGVEFAAGQLDVSRQRCWRHLCPSAEPGAFHRPVDVQFAGPKTERHYDRLIAAVARVLMDHLPDESDPRLFMNTTLWMLERIFDGIPENPADRWTDWDKLVERYAALYEQYDPDMVSPDIERGERLGKALLEVVG